MKIKGKIYSKIIDKNYIGKECIENYRYVVDKYGDTIKQGLGLKGVVKDIWRNRYTGVLVAEFNISTQFRFCELKHISIL